jgi:hypothetical protein
MNPRTSRLVIIVALATSCGDWPWPMDNPNDPLRCDPQCEAPFVCENAACVYDPCKLNACNGHGMCTSDATSQTFTCECKDGWEGPECQSCADGYTGYPNCHCQCSPGQRLCDGESIKTCNGACQWVSQSCSEVCRSGNGEYAFCASANMNSGGQCYCSSGNAASAAVEFKITASCPFSAAVYDQTSGTALSGAASISPGTPMSEYVTCVPGHKVCWGAWSEKYYSGCGLGCVRGCDACCVTCPAGGTAVRSPDYDINLNCSPAGTGGSGGSGGGGGSGGSRSSSSSSSRSSQAGGGSGGKASSSSKGGAGGSRTSKPTTNCSKISMSDCDLGILSTSIGDRCRRAGCQFDLGDCVSHGSGITPDFITCECRCY